MILFCIALHRIEGMIGCVEMRAPAHYWPFRTVGGKLHCLAVSLLIIMMMKQNIIKRVNTLQSITIITGGDDDRKIDLVHNNVPVGIFGK